MAPRAPVQQPSQRTTAFGRDWDYYSRLSPHGGATCDRAPPGPSLVPAKYQIMVQGRYSGRSLQRNGHSLRFEVRPEALFAQLAAVAGHFVAAEGGSSVKD